MNDARHVNTCSTPCIYILAHSARLTPPCALTFLRVDTQSRRQQYHVVVWNAEKKDEVCSGEQGVHCRDAGRRHRAQGAGGQALLLGGEAGAGRVGARGAVVVVGRQGRRRRRHRGVAEDGHVPQLLGTKLGYEVKPRAAAVCAWFDQQLYREVAKAAGRQHPLSFSLSSEIHGTSCSWMDALVQG